MLRWEGGRETGDRVQQHGDLVISSLKGKRSNRPSSASNLIENGKSWAEDVTQLTEYLPGTRDVGLGSIF